MGTAGGTVLNVSVYRYSRIMRPAEIALTRDRFTRVRLGGILSSLLASPVAPTKHRTTSRTIRAYIDAFSEHASSDPLSDLAKFLKVSGLTGSTPGGIKTGSSILSYAPAAIMPNAAATGAIGEGLAGWFMERLEGMKHHARPIGVCPDAIFFDPTTNRYVLAEAKAVGKSQRANSQTKRGAMDVLDVLAKTKLIRKGKYMAYTITTVILGLQDFELHAVRLEEA